ncbi:alpha/beta fold hydrolase [Paenibacillus kobensis]|uniref:alpha/beta fold hydrolase n=1 Tax=Paenibacillus kobensis TaxID=59841 RepID=UPI000FD84FF0|nr:alpha/beta fold hydrolase [Paenibacillus kobensis]
MTAAERMSFSVIVRNTDYIVRDHQVFGVSIMPGVTYIDILFRYLEMKGFQLAACELRHVLFVEPVVTTPSTDRKLMFELVRKADYWSVTAGSREVKDGITDEAGSLTVHFECKVYDRKPEAAEYVDTARLKREALSVADMDDAYAYNRIAQINHYTFMKSEGTVHQGEDFLLAELTLSHLARQYVDEFLLHPAFLDSASIVPALFLKKKPDGGKAEMSSSGTGSSTFIPIYVDSVRVTGKLGPVCYVHVRESRDMYKQSSDIAYLNLDLLNQEGKLIARLTKFGCKNVRSQNLIQKLEGNETSAAGANPIASKPQAAQAVTATVAPTSKPAVPEPVSTSGPASRFGGAGCKLIERDLLQLLAGMNGSVPDSMNPDTSFYELGLDSRQLLTFADRLEEKLGKELYPTLLFEYTTAASLAAFLFEHYGDDYPVVYSATPSNEQARDAGNIEADSGTKQAVTSAAASGAAAQFGAEGRQLIERSILELLAGMSNCTPETMDPDVSFYELGLDSRQLLTFADLLEEKLGKELYPTLLFEYTTASALSAFLLEEYGDLYPVVKKSSTPISSSKSQIELKPVMRASSQPNESLTKEQQIRRDLQQIIAGLTDRETQEVNIDLSFYEQGMDSRQLLTFVDRLEAKLGFELYPTLMFEYTNIEGLAAYLLETYEDSYPFADAGALRSTAPAAPAAEHESAPQIVPALASIPAAASDKVKEGLLCFDTQWQPAQPGLSVGLGRNVLLFEDGDLYMEEMAQQLRSEGVKVVSVRPSALFEGSGDRYAIRPEAADDYEQLIDAVIASDIFPDTVIHGWSTERQHTASEQMDAGVRSVFRLVKAIERRREGRKLQLVYVFEVDPILGCPAYEAVGGLLKSVGLEIQAISVKTVEVQLNGGKAPEGLARMLIDEAGKQSPDQVHIRLAEGERLVKRIVSIQNDVSSMPEEIKAKDGGVYVITGGHGALGRLTARYWSKQAKVQLVLVGRSPVSEEIRSELSAIEQSGSSAVYVQGDISNKEGASRLIEEVKSRFGSVNGVIHSAGVVKDNLISRKTAEEAEQVWAPKVFGTLCLDEALGDEPLDFFIIYSSLAAVSGNAGQSDYAYGNSFQDSFSAAREALRSSGQRHGRTLSINWPFWEDGGMHMPPRMKDLISQATGMLPLPTDSGLQALAELLRIPGHSLGVTYGDVAKISATLGVTGRMYKPVASRATTSEYPVFLHLSEEEEDATRVYIKLLGKNRRLAQRYLIRTESSALTEVMTFGEGPPLLLIPAFGYTAPQWNSQLEAWSRQHRVIVFHPPGSGLSLGGEDVAYETVCRGLIEALDALGVQEPLPVFASSWGGMVAMSFASLYPERVQSLVLAGCFHSVSLEESTRLKEMLKIDFDHNGASDLYEAVFQTQYMSSAVAKYATAQMFPNGIASTESYLTGIEVPVCIIAGEEDQVFSRSRTEELLSLLPHASLQLIPKAGHFPHCTSADTFNQIAMSFVETSQTTPSMPIAAGQNG